MNTSEAAMAERVNTSESSGDESTDSLGKHVPTSSSSDSDDNHGKSPPGPSDRQPTVKRPRTQVSSTTPLTSGCFDFIRWCIQHRLTSDECTRLVHKMPSLSFGSFCAGMGTEDIALQGMVIAFQELGYGALDIRHRFKAEQHQGKLQFLMQRHRSRGTLFFKDNKDLAASEPCEVTGKDVTQPSCDIASIGIVCTDISGFNVNPRSLHDRDGNSGKSLYGMFEWLKALQCNNRPSCIIMECVERIRHRRKVDDKVSTGANFVLSAMNRLGYSGKWFTVSPEDYFLPQSRARAYGLFLLRRNSSREARASRDRDLQVVSELVTRCQCSPPEPLTKMLSDEMLMPCKTRAHTSPGNKWKARHADFIKRCNLLPEDITPPQDFLEAIGNGLSDRARDVLWLSMVQQKHKTGFDWHKDFAVIPHGLSVGWSMLHSTRLPCVTPKSPIIVIKGGKFSMVSEHGLLAAQGVQGKERKAFNLNHKLPSGVKLQDLAGNSFAANVIGVFLIAAIMVK